MGKSQNKTRRSSIIITIIYIIIIGLLSSLTIYNFSSISKEESKRNEIKKEYDPIKKEYDSYQESKDKISKEIDDIKDTDNKIIKIKEEVFTLAKQVEEKIKNNETDKKIAYLTFDDGPYYQTDKVLALLKEYKIKATFFTIGAGKEKCFDNKSVSCMETYKKITDANHTIANHTYSHSIFYGLDISVDAFMEQVQKQEDLIKDKTGVTTNILRFPGGSVTAGRLKEGIINRLREKGYGYVDWTSEDGDGRDLTSREQAWNLFTRTIDEDIEVILFHDYDNYRYSILPDAIKYLEEKDYILLPLFYDSVMVNK